MGQQAAPVRDIFVEANGLRHHLLARGHPGAPVVICIHGLTQQAHVFDVLAAKLATKYHVYCLDVRGRGESEWGPPDGYHLDNYIADFEAVRAALELDRFALIGISLGGLISMGYIARYPERVSRVVLDDIGPAIPPDGLQRILTILTSAPDGFTDLKAVAKYYRDDNPIVLASRSDEEVMDYARWHVRKADTGLYTWKLDPAVRRMLQPPAPAITPWDAFRAITCPILVVRGAQSDVLSRETLDEMKAATPGLRSIEIPGVGHAPSLAEPESIKAIEAFLGEG